VRVVGNFQNSMHCLADDRVMRYTGAYDIAGGTGEA